MLLTEFNEQLLSKKKKKQVDVPIITDSDFIQFKQLLTLSRVAQSAYETLDDSKSFFKMYPSFKTILGAAVAEECFYAIKVGYYVKGIPMELIYIISKMKEVYPNTNTINLAIKATMNLLKPFLGCEYLCEDKKYTLKTILESMYESKLEFVTSAYPKVVHDGTSEVYISGEDMIALFPKDITELISIEDCLNITYDRDKGLMLGSIPIRTLNSRLGITRNDFDLRESI